jgi:hypothetical protein
LGAAAPSTLDGSEAETGVAGMAMKRLGCGLALPAKTIAVEDISISTQQ